MFVNMLVGKKVIFELYKYLTGTNLAIKTFTWC